MDLSVGLRFRQNPNPGGDSGVEPGVKVGESSSIEDCEKARFRVVFSWDDESDDGDPTIESLTKASVVRRTSWAHLASS